MNADYAYPITHVNALRINPQCKMHVVGDSSKEAQGERLKWARARAGIKPEDFARAVRMPYSTYMNYENGFRRLRADQAILFAERLGLQVKWLATGDGSRFVGQSHPILEIFEKLPVEQQALIERMLSGLATDPVDC